MFSDLLNIMVQSLELFSSENKKRVTNALTVLQVIILYTLAFHVYPPWFPRILAVVAFFGLLYAASEKQTEILYGVDFFEFLVNLLEEFEHDFGVDLLAKKEEVVKHLAEKAMDLVHSGYIDAKRALYMSVIRAFQYFPFFFLVASLSERYLSNILEEWQVLQDLHVLVVLYVSVSIALLLLRVNLHTLASLSVEEYGPLIGTTAFIVMVSILTLLPLLGIEEVFSPPNPRHFEYVLRYRTHLSAPLDREARKFFETLVSDPNLIIYHWSSHTYVNYVKATREKMVQYLTQRLDTLIRRAELTTVDIYNNIYVVGDTKSGDASIVIFTVAPKTRISSYDRKGFPKRQIVEYHLVINEVAIGRSIIADIISRISKNDKQHRWPGFYYRAN